MIIVGEEVLPVYYAQPGLEKGAPRVELIPTVGIVENGRIRHIPTEPGVLGPGGKLRVDPASLTAIPAKEFLAVVNAVLEAYRESPYAQQRQISNIWIDVVASIHGQEYVYLIPIADTMHLPPLESLRKAS